MHASRLLCFFLIVAFLRPVQTWASDASENAVRAPSGRFLLIKQDKRCLALRFLEHPERDPRRSRYEWFVQNDGSFNFQKTNITQGKGEVWGREANPDGSTNTIIKAGPFRLFWSASNWVYFPQWNVDSLISMARTQWTRLEDVNVQSKGLKWISGGTLIAWGPEQDGFKLGVGEFRREASTGDIVSWRLLVRNVDKMSKELIYYYPPSRSAQPKIIGPLGRAIQVEEPLSSTPMSRMKQILKPGEVFPLCIYYLRLGRDYTNNSDKSIEATPGKYSISFSYRFRDYREESWKGVLTTGITKLSVLPAPNP
ncbi:MAG TPA: hypothetical protein VGB77_03500 [Abditibacteriaceae bacterium]|jgi:hypothetical protein